MKCECKGHPFNCYNHPHDCGCMSNETTRTNKLKHIQWTETDLLIRDEAYKIGWNDAIEAAAKLVWSDEYYDMDGAALSDEIRKLKK